jgi:hypothetical protein
MDVNYIARKLVGHLFMRWDGSSKWLMAMLIAALAPLPALDARGALPHSRAGIGVAGMMQTAAAANYRIKIAGYMQGSGQAQLSGSSLSLSATVSQDGGSQGAFSANNLTIDASSHFRGTGTALGQTVTIGGRLDDPRGNETQLKTRRLVGTFFTASGSYGRVVGYVPLNSTSVQNFAAH